MPTSLVKTTEDEKLWEKAKRIAAREGYTNNYGYITNIFKRMKGLKSLVLITDELELLNKGINNIKDDIDEAIDILEKSLQERSNNEPLIKAIGHKYIKREMKGGKWVYWYKDSSGKLYSSDKGPELKNERSVEEDGKGKLTRRADGFYYTEKGQKITNDPEKAKEYEKKSIARMETPIKSDIKPGMKIRVKPTAKSGSVREFTRGIVGTISSIQDGMVHFIDEAGKAFKAPVNILEFAKSHSSLIEPERHSYSGFGNQARKKVKGYKSGYKKPAVHTRIGRSFKRSKPKERKEM